MDQRVTSLENNMREIMADLKRLSADMADLKRLIPDMADLKRDLAGVKLDVGRNERPPVANPDDGPADRAGFRDIRRLLRAVEIDRPSIGPP
jgi:hypothetical protein